MGTMAAEPFKVGLNAAGKTAVPFFMRSSPAGRAAGTGLMAREMALPGTFWR